LANLLVFLVVQAVVGALLGAFAPPLAQEGPVDRSPVEHRGCGAGQDGVFRAVRRRWLEPGLWWLVLSGLWLLTATPLSIPEVVVAGVVAVPCALAARPARRATSRTWRLRGGWVRWLPAVAVAVLADTARVLAVPVHGRDRGALRRTRLPAEPDETVAATRRAVVTILLSLSPGSYVVDWSSAETGADVVVTHALTDGRPRLDEVLGR
jgi:hypothetical protein